MRNYQLVYYVKQKWVNYRDTGVSINRYQIMVFKVTFEQILYHLIKGCIFALLIQLLPSNQRFHSKF